MTLEHVVLDITTTVYDITNFTLNRFLGFLIKKRQILIMIDWISSRNLSYFKIIFLSKNSGYKHVLMRKLKLTLNKSLKRQARKR